MNEGIKKAVARAARTHLKIVEAEKLRLEKRDQDQKDEEKAVEDEFWAAVIDKTGGFDLKEFVEIVQHRSVENPSPNVRLVAVSLPGCLPIAIKFHRVIRNWIQTSPSDGASNAMFQVLYHRPDGTLEKNLGMHETWEGAVGEARIGFLEAARKAITDQENRVDELERELKHLEKRLSNAKDRLRDLKWHEEFESKRYDPEPENPEPETPKPNDT